MLHAKGQSNDGDAEHHAQCQVRQTYPYASNEKPDDVQQKRNRTCILVFDFIPKRGKSNHRQFDALHPPWDANDGDTHRNTSGDVFERDGPTTKNVAAP